jgi:hypothetical protein
MSMTRREAIDWLLEGVEIGEERRVTLSQFKRGAYYCFRNGFIYKDQSFSDHEPCFRFEDGYEKVIEHLTFERIKKECVPMEHLLVDEQGDGRLYLGFNRDGKLVTDHYTGSSSSSFDWRHEDYIKNWTIKPYKKED